MRLVLQRVREAAVAVVETASATPDPAYPSASAAGPALSGEGALAPTEREVARIGRGLLVLVGFAGGETEGDLDWVADKVLALRVFGLDGGFDLSVRDAGGEVLVISQFTLLAELRGGRRPDFARAAPAGTASGLYEAFVRRLRERHPAVHEGVFGAEMRVSLVNDGPATFLLERGDSPAAAGPA